MLDFCSTFTQGLFASAAPFHIKLGHVFIHGIHLYQVSGEYLQDHCYRTVCPLSFIAIVIMDFRYFKPLTSFCVRFNSYIVENWKSSYFQNFM